MLDELDQTLKKLLEQEVADLDESSQNVRFEAPDSDFAPPQPAVNLFLYDVRENRELRSNEWLVERNSDGTISRQPAPVRVDCSYMITAWAGDAASEHRLLGKVMKALLRYPTLPESILQGELQQQAVAPPTSSLQPGRLQSLGEFWQAMQGKPRATLNYTVTIGVLPEEPVEAGPPVVDKLLKFKLGAEEA